jgi:NADPH:quinone reductase-like Zn-dependent oxidoreductase
MVLPSLAKGSQTAVIQCSLNIANGMLEITSGPGTVHVTAHAARVGSNKLHIQLQGQRWQRSILSAVKTPEKATMPQTAISNVHSCTGRSGLWMDPAVFDCFLQLGQVFVVGTSEVYVPAGLGALKVSGSASCITQQENQAAWASTVPTALENSVQSDFQLLSGAAEELCGIAALIAKSMGKAVIKPAARAVKTAECLYEVSWQANEPSSSVLASGEDCWLLETADGAKEVAASAISAAQRLLRHSASGNYQLQSADTSMLQATPAAAAGLYSPLGLAASALSGLVKTLNQECPQVSWSAVNTSSLSPSFTGQQAKIIALAERPVADAFGTVSFSGASHAPLMLRSLASESLPAFHIMPNPRGSLNSLVPVPVDIKAPLHPDQLLMAVKAVGLNFRDVLNVLGMYPGDPGPPGGDCAGTILQGTVMHGDTVLAGPGDAVFGLAAGSLGSHVVASGKTVVPMPLGIGFQEAATMPTVFVTVDTALNRLAAISPGSKVLVHAAAGGVGLAAMQIIKAAGAQGLTTAGSPSKRALLRMLGAKRAASSRDIAFVGELLETGGSADVVLNTLTSIGMVAASLALLNCGAHFVEISKRDIWSGARMAQGT